MVPNLKPRLPPYACVRICIYKLCGGIYFVLFYFVLARIYLVHCVTFPMVPNLKSRLPPCLRAGVSLPVLRGVLFCCVRYTFVSFFLPCREQRARMDVDEPTAKAVGGEILPMIFVVSKAIEYIKNQILDRVVSQC